jgi:hypothetical protein
MPLSRPNPPTCVLPFPVRAHSTTDYRPRDRLELPLSKNQKLEIVDVKSEHWYIARTTNLEEGWVPAAYIKLHSPIEDMDIPGLFRGWEDKVRIAFGGKKEYDADGNVKEYRRVVYKTFPWLPNEVLVCERTICKLRKEEKELGACVHDVEMLLRGVGDEYSAKWLFKESLRWHPDRFGRKCNPSWRDEGTKIASEMFIILQELIDIEKQSENEMERQNT